MDNQIPQVLKASKEEILVLWNQKLSDENITSGNNEESEESDDFLTALLNAVSASEARQSNEFEIVHDILSGISISRAKRGFTPRETSLYIFTLKETLLEILSQKISNTEDLYNESLRVTKLVDNMAILTFESYVKGREEVILRQTDEIAEISTPVIKVWDGIVALPIIGTLDSARTQIIMESLLQQIVDTGSSIAILDISGVPAVDTLVAQHLIKTVSATRLMGAECIISGIRPEIAQTIVHLGIDLTGIITKATLANALLTAFTMLKLEVQKKRVNIAN